MITPTLIPGTPAGGGQRLVPHAVYAPPVPFPFIDMRTGDVAG
jgi:hypothetical protein